MAKKSPFQIKAMHKELDMLPRITKCENPGNNACGGRIERNHALFYCGRKIEEEYALRALCSECHRGNNGTIHRMADLVCKINAITEGMEHLKANYTKANWEQELRRYLFEKKSI